MTENKSEGPFKNRHKARELALQTLYACEVGKNEDEWQSMLDRIADTGSLSLDVKKYASDLVQEVYSSSGKIDEQITEKAANWELRRMAAIDRNILRLAVAEMSCFTQVPVKVVIDEAVELAKEFGTEDSGKFVNGIIDSIHKKMKKQSDTSRKDGPQNGTDPLQA
ncbi:MAG: transcription antitermination factor NusB [Fibrobacter sp.]|nr:transcription antitermination factor NusB [Fibrobacter sp.]